MKKTIEALENNKKETLEYIKSKGIPFNDIEDVYQECICELLMYYKDTEDPKAQFRLFSLAVNSQVSKYFKENGNVASPSEEVTEQCIGYTFDQMFEEQQKHSRSPLDFLIEEERLIDYRQIVDDFDGTDAQKHLLELIYVDGIEPPVAQDIVGFTRQNASYVLQKFLNQVGG